MKMGRNLHAADVMRLSNLAWEGDDHTEYHHMVGNAASFEGSGVVIPGCISGWIADSMLILDETAIGMRLELSL